VSVYDAAVSLIVLKLIDWTIGLRVSERTELEGLDVTLHGEAVQ
jgi:Amt family ammonium transporter